MTTPITSSSPSASTSSSSSSPSTTGTLSTNSTSTGGATSNVQGLASGIDWEDLIDQLMQVDTDNEITPITNKITADNTSQSAWTAFGTAVSTLQTTLKTLADGSVFNALTVNAPESSVTSRTLLTATTTSAAAPGTYGVQVLSTAAAQELSSNIVSDPTAALGISGQFAVAGNTITLASTDSLNDVRDKINALNTGSAPSHISASILYSGTTAARLVVTSDVGGSAGLDLRDIRATSSDPSVLTSLGFIDGETANVGSDGAVRSAAFSSSAQTVGALMSGITTFPAPSTIMVNGRSVSIDVQNSSLSDIAAAINAQSPNSASVETVTSGSTTTYDLKISGTVTASSDPGSQPILDLLGLTHGTTGVVQQQVSTSNVLQDASGSTATSATALLGLQIAGGKGAQVGDTFTITGTKPDGTAATLTETVGASNTIGDMLTDIGNAFSASGRPVTAAIVGGEIQLTDTTGGDSSLSFSIAANNESGVADPVNGGSLSFGATTVDAEGRERQLAAGQDAKILVNGVLITRNTNTISDAITGVTLNLQQAEVGTTIPVTVTRDTSQAVDALQSVATAYNTIQTLVASDIAPGGPLAFDSSVSSAFNALKDTILSAIPGLPTGGAYNQAPLVGLTLDETGVMSLDTDTFTAALTQDPDGVKELFETGGEATGTGLSYLSSSSASQSGNYDIQITRAGTTPSVASTDANFDYAAGSSTDTLTIGDSFSGKSGTITLATGDTPDSVAAKLNALFQAQGIRASAASNNGVLSVNGLDYGSAASLTLSYASSGGNDVAGQLGIAAGTVSNGLDVQGSFSSGGQTYTATGNGQTLTGGSGTPVDGLMVLYNGTADSSTGHIDYSTGIAGMMTNVANSVTATGGTVAIQNAALASEVTTLTQRQSDVQERLDNTRASLEAQYTAMETALSTIQSDGNYLTQQINSMTNLQSSNS